MAAGEHSVTIREPRREGCRHLHLHASCKGPVNTILSKHLQDAQVNTFDSSVWPYKIGCQLAGTVRARCNNNNNSNVATITIQGEKSGVPQ